MGSLKGFAVGTGGAAERPAYPASGLRPTAVVMLVVNLATFYLYDTWSPYL